MKNSFKQPDLNGPRFRPKSKNILTKNLYERFLSKYPEYKDLSAEDFKKIITTFNGKICEGIIDNRNGVELPDGLGYLFIGTCPPAKKKNIDIGKSRKYGVATTHKNWDSDNNLMKIFYTNHASRYPFQNKQVWAFKGVKQFRKAASDAYKVEWPKYIVVDDKRKISSMFAKMRKRDYILADSQITPDNYDEFKM